jgi:protein-tyrosine phosphatase
MERVELHFHLLPGVDDGPADLPAALELAREAVADGTRLVTCTPHVRDVDVSEIPERVRELRGALERAGIGLEVRRGAELAWDDLDRLDGASLDRLAQGPAGRRWLLLEAPLPGAGELEDFEAAARELRDRGFGLLIGHPERSPAVSRAPGAVDRLLAAGDRLQVNGSSLTGSHGAEPRAAGLALARAGHITVIASDAHRPITRGPVLGQAVSVLRQNGADADAAQRLTAANPRALLEQGLVLARRLAA